MRVALLSRGAHPLHAPGGMERAVYHLAHHLRRRGVETVLFTRPATRPGVFPGEVVEVPYGGSEDAHGRVLDRTLRYPRFALRLGQAVAREVRAGRVNVVDAQGLTALGYGRLRKRDPTLRAPLLMNPQGMEEHKTRGLKRIALARLRALSRSAARVADRVIATDERTRGEVIELLGADPARVSVLPNAVDLDEIAAATPEDPAACIADAFPELAAARPLLLSVGRIEGYKGFGETLDALAALHQRGALPQAWTWAVAGDGPQREALARRARRDLGTEAAARHVRWLGRVDDRVLHALYARADAFVHVPRYEGSSLVTLEAMAHAAPVVATCVGGIPDKIEDGASGWLVAPGDMEGLQRALLELLAAPERARVRGERARRTVSERYAWTVAIEQVLALYARLLDEARS